MYHQRLDFRTNKHRTVAQRLEQGTHNPFDGDSNPSDYCTHRSRVLASYYPHGLLDIGFIHVWLDNSSSDRRSPRVQKTTLRSNLRKPTKTIVERALRHPRRSCGR